MLFSHTIQVVSFYKKEGTMKIVTAYEGLYETSDLRPNDLLQLVINVAGVGHTIFRLFSSFNTSTREFHLLKSDGYSEYLPSTIVKQITILARDAQLAFQYLGSFQEEVARLSEMLQFVASLTDQFHNDIKQRCS